MKHRSTLISSAFAVVASLASLAHADSLWVGSGGGSGGSSGGGSGGGLELKDIRILRIDGGRIHFRTASGESSRELSQVQRLALDDEPALTSAESAFVAGKFDTATDDYLRVSRSTTKPWLKQWVALRLMKSATSTNRFEPAVTAYIDLVQTDPRLAQDNRPSLTGPTPPKPGMLDAAATELEKALERKLPPEQKQALQQFLLDIYRARGDSAKAASLLEQLSGVAGSASGAPGAAGTRDLGAAKALADLRLSAANVALDAKDFPKAISTIEQNQPVFTDPKHQAEALFILASAREGLARAAKDPAQLKDAALSYMRVVAHFRGVAGAESRIGISLLKTAQILEELGEKAEARSLYKELADSLDVSLKVPARQGLERLK